MAPYADYRVDSPYQASSIYEDSNLSSPALSELPVAIENFLEAIDGVGQTPLCAKYALDTDDDLSHTVRPRRSLMQLIAVPISQRV